MGKIQIEGKWWKWEEDEEILRDGEGKVWNIQREGVGNRERERDRWIRESGNMGESKERERWARE